MRILRIVYDWPPPWGGLAPHPYELTASQAKMDHEIDVFCGRWPKAGTIEQPPNVNIKGFWREPFPGTVSITTSVLMFLRYWLWRRSIKPDLIHTHGHFALWIFAYRALLKKIKKNSDELTIPLVAHFHNTVAGRANTLAEKGTEIKTVSKLLDWPMAKLSDRLAVSNADAMIFVSEETRKEAMEFYGAEESKSFIIESGVNPEFFKPVGPDEKDKTRRDLGFDRADRVLVYVGHMIERKNIHLLVDALAQLPTNYKLILAGAFVDKDYQSKINDVIFVNKLKDRVIMTGYVPYPNLPVAYQAADLFVLPSSWEGAPKVVMESLACGVPVLASGFKLTEDIGGLSYLDGLTSEQIATQISQIMANPPYVDVEKVKSLYSWDLRAAAVEEVYEFVKKSTV